MSNSMFSIEVKHRKTSCLPNQPHHFTCTSGTWSFKFLHSCHIWSLFLDYSHSVGVKWYFIMALIFISMLVNNGEHLSMCLLPIYIYINFFFENHLYPLLSFSKTLGIFKIILVIQFPLLWISVTCIVLCLQSGTYTVSTVLLPFHINYRSSLG